MADIGPIRGRRFGRMYRRFETHASVRLKRLLVAGLCRCAGGDLPDIVRMALDLLERWADGLDTEAAHLAAVDRLRQEADRLSEPSEQLRRASFMQGDKGHPALEALRDTSVDREARVLEVVAGVLRDVAVNPPDVWRPIVELRLLAASEYQSDPPGLPPDTVRDRMTRVLTDMVVTTLGPTRFDPRWRTTDVLGLAHGIYEDRAFDRMPILADALLDAGCDRPRVIDHCREPGAHYRGCWVLDAVLRLR